MKTNSFTTFLLSLFTFGMLNSLSAQSDTTKFTVGSNQVLIIKCPVGNEALESDTTDIDNMDNKNKDQLIHWGGFEIGVNGYLNNKGTSTMANPLYDLDYSRSLQFNLNLFEKKINIVNEYVGIVTGLGFSFNNYQFKNSTILTSTKDSTFAWEDTTTSYIKNKLKVTYIKIPLLLEFNTSLDEDKSFHIAGGIEAGFKIGSKTKLKYEVGNNTQKDKNKGHYNLNPWKINAVARVGFKNFTIYANYGLTSLFETNKGPELYPFEVGLSIVPF